MAKQQGILRLRGTINGINFYLTRHGFMARASSTVSKERIQHDPAFERTRENMGEFALVSRAGKYLRTAVRSLAHRCSDPDMNTRLVKLLFGLKNQDEINIRGQRNVATALENPALRKQLKGFEFNRHTTLSRMLFNPFLTDTATGSITLSNLDVSRQIVFPSMATHVSLRSAWVKVDFATGAHELRVSDPILLDRHAPVQTIVLSPAAPPAGTGVSLYLLKVEFSQEVNDNDYRSDDEKYTVLSVVEVG